MSPLLVLPKNDSIDSKKVCSEWIPKILENFDENVDPENALSHIFYCDDAVDGFDKLEACDEWLNYIYLGNSRSTSYKGKCAVHDEHYLERKRAQNVGDLGIHDDANANEIIILEDILNRPLYDHVIDVDFYIELDSINNIDLRGAFMDVTFTRTSSFKFFDQKSSFDFLSSVKDVRRLVRLAAKMEQNRIQRSDVHSFRSEQTLDAAD